MTEMAHDDPLTFQTTMLLRLRLPLVAVLLVNFAMIARVPLSHAGNKASRAEPVVTRAAPLQQPAAVPDRGHETPSPDIVGPLVTPADVPDQPAPDEPIAVAPDEPPTPTPDVLAATQPNEPPDNQVPRSSAAPIDLAPRVAWLTRGAQWFLDGVASTSRDPFDEDGTTAGIPPVEPALSGPSQPAAQAQLVLINPSENGGPVNFVIDGTAYSLQPGESRSWDGAADVRWLQFDRGDNLGVVEALLTQGTYRFSVSSEGWSLDN